MQAFLIGIFSDLRIAWSFAAIFMIISLLSAFRRRLGLDGLLTRLDAEAMLLQQQIIATQQRSIDSKDRLIAVLRRSIDDFDSRSATADEALERLRHIMRLEGILPWEDDH